MPLSMSDSLSNSLGGILKEIYNDYYNPIVITRKYKGIKKVILIDRNYFEPKETILIHWEV